MKKTLAVLAVAGALTAVAAPSASAVPPNTERICNALTAAEQRVGTPGLFIIQAIKKRLCPPVIVVS